MLKLALRGVRYNAGRYIATLVAIMTGVAFFTATGFMSDRVISALEADARAQYSGVDAAINVDDDPDAPGADFASDLRLSGDTVDEIAALDEVEAVGGDLVGSVAFLADDGTTFADGATGRLWIEDDELNPIDVETGDAPLADGEVAIDRGLAADESLAIGDTVTLLALSGEHEVAIVGITAFGENDSEDQDGTVSISAVNAFAWLNNGAVEYQDLFIRGNVDESALVEAVEPLVPNGFIVQTGEDFIQEQVDNAGAFGRFLKIGLQVFAALALFVGAFVIFNTFSVIVAQRLRELAVLAAIGATPKQIKRSLRFEGLLIGIVGSILGVITGFLLAFLLVAVLTLVGVELPGSGIKITPTVVVQGLLAGTLITFFSVMRPARKAAKTEPIEALRQSAVEGESLTRGRIIVTVALVGIGALGMLTATAGGALGLSAVLFFVGMIVAGPMIALGGSKLFKPVLRRFGLEGRLAADNVGRNPQRTATTANALLIGVFLVTLVTVAGTSLKDFAVSKIDELAATDFYLDSDGGVIDDELIAEVSTVDGVNQVVPIRTEVVVRSGGETTAAGSDEPMNTPSALTTGDFAAIAEVSNIELLEGSIDDLGAGQVIVADGPDVPVVGTTVTYVDSAGNTADLEVVGVMKGTLDSSLLGALVTDDTYTAFSGESQPNQALIDAADGQQTEVEDSIKEVTDRRPDLTLQRGSEFSELVGTIFDFLINAVNGLLLMSVVVALIGIVNTLSLSILERRRELGLLRIVGMVDKRVRKMVRIESMLISILGTVTGVAMGIFTGFALVFAINRLSDAGIALDFAPLQILLVLVLGVLLGFLAALIPAQRSTRLEVLDAINAT